MIKTKQDRPVVELLDLGITDYKKAWDLQTTIQKSIIDQKRGLETEESSLEWSSTLLLCEHPHVYTLGKSGSMDHLLLSDKGVESKGAQFYKINRGGDITYHGPGQMVAYPILDMDLFFHDVHRYVRCLEEVIIRLLGDYGLKGLRIPSFTGVWLPETKALPARKICAIGVHLSRWVSLHGLAFNAQPDLSMFNHIVPCGIPSEDKKVTSLAAETESDVDNTLLKSRFVSHFMEVFECQVSHNPKPK